MLLTVTGTKNNKKFCKNNAIFFRSELSEGFNRYCTVNGSQSVKIMIIINGGENFVVEGTNRIPVVLRLFGRFQHPAVVAHLDGFCSGDDYCMRTTTGPPVTSLFGKVLAF